MVPDHREEAVRVRTRLWMIVGVSAWIALAACSNVGGPKLDSSSAADSVPTFSPDPPRAMHGVQRDQTGYAISW